MSHPTPVPTKTAKFNKLTYKKVAPRLIKLVLEEKSLLFFGTVALLGGAGLNLTFPYLIKTYLNQNLSIDQVSSSVTNLSVILILLFLVQGLCFYYRHYLLQLLGLSVVKKIRSSLYSALISQDISFFDAQRLGDLLSRLGADTEAVQKGVSVNVSVVIRYLIQVIGGLALMLYLSPFLTGLILLLVPLLGVFSVLWSKKLRFFSKELQVILGELSTKAEEALTAIRVVKIFGSEKLEIEKFKITNTQAYELGDKRTKIAAIFSSSMVTLLHCSIVVVMWIGVSQVVNSKLSMGDLTAFLLYCTIVAVSFGFLINAWAEFVSALGAGERVYEIIDSAPRVISNNENKSINLELAPEIEFRNVSFSYPSRPDTLALRNINLNFPSGKKIALVGPSGSGKSTLASLIGRLYDPTSGAVLVNGEDLKNISLASYRSFLAYVPQQPQLFSGSIYDNITYGLADIESSKVDSIIDLSALRSKISNLPEGLQTRIGDKGVQLSGGERQRVSIARALIRDPKLLVFDEATSSLDSENENLIKEALERVSKGRTTLIIAHRLSTVKDADLVIVLKDGEVLEQGSHEELIGKAGLYKSLVEYQLLDG